MSGTHVQDATVDFCCLVHRPSRFLPAVVKVQSAGDDGPDLYFAAELPCDVAAARAWEVVGYRPRLAGHQDAARVYQVLVATPKRGESARGECTCKGGTLGSARPKACRHVRFLSALWMKGEL